MAYEKTITVPANTTKENPIIKEYTLEYGIITGMAVKFPAGCYGLVHVVVKRFESQILPYHEGDDINGDDETVPFITYIPMLEKPFSVKIVCWNEDDTYDHTISVRIEVLPPEVANPSWYFAQIADRLELLLRRIGAL